VQYIVDGAIPAMYAYPKMLWHEALALRTIRNHM